jgi:predicted ATPase
MKSEIRESEITALLDRLRKSSYRKYLTGMRLVKLCGFSNREIRFDFPVTALVGPNGAGKTRLRCLALRA